MPCLLWYPQAVYLSQCNIKQWPRLSIFAFISTITTFLLTFLFCWVVWRGLWVKTPFLSMCTPSWWYFLVCRAGMCAGLPSDWQGASLSWRQSFTEQDKLCLSCIECHGLCRWEASRMSWPVDRVARAGHPSLREGNVRCPRSGFDSVLLLYDPHVLSLSCIPKITNALIKDLLLYTETGDQLRLSLKLWLLSFFKISTGFACGPGPRNLPVEFSVSWSHASLRCHPFLPKCVVSFL